jgi:dienelactone hydrolase
MDHAPRLSFGGPDPRTQAVVLLLHGGATDSFHAVRAFDPSVLRMVPFGRNLVRGGDGRIAVAKLRYAVRGWNGERHSPLADARWALDRIAEHFGALPLGLVGHSMGGRVALRVADQGGVLEDADGTPHTWGVRSVAALAPWLPDGEPTPSFGGRPLLLAHGTADRVTDPAKTTELADRLAAEGAEVELVKYPGAHHSMLFPARPWHEMVTRFMVRTLLAPT